MRVFASIIILNWNTSSDTIECINSLKTQTFKNFEIVLVDNGSRKDEAKRLENFLKKEKKLRIKFIQNKRNLGFCEGNNIGIRASKGDFVVFLNNDTIVDKNWLKALIEPFLEDEKVGITASKVFFYDGKNNDIIQYVGGKFTYYGMAINEGSGTKDRKDYNIPKETFFAMGVSFAIRKKIFGELEETFPSIYFIYSEEVDLSWRVKNLGYKILYCPSSVLYHKGSVAIKKGGLLSRQDRLSLRNKYLTVWRNLPIMHTLIIFPLMLTYDIGRSFKHFFCGRPGFIFAFILGFKDFIFTVSKVKKTRKGSIFQLTW